MGKLKQTLASIVLAGALAIGGLTNKTNAGNIAYITNQNELNPRVAQVLNDTKNNYNIIKDADIPSTDFDDYDMVLISELQEDFSNYLKIPINNKNSLIFGGNWRYTPNWKISGWDSGMGASGLIMGGTKLVDNKITVGLPDYFNFYTTDIFPCTTFLPSSQDRAQGLINLVTIGEIGQPVPLPITNPLETERMVIGYIQKGGVLLNEGLSEAETIYFGIMTPEYWTSESEQLFKNSINELVPEPSTIGLLGLGALTLRRKKK